MGESNSGRVGHYRVGLLPPQPQYTFCTPQSAPQSTHNATQSETRPFYNHKHYRNIVYSSDNGPTWSIKSPCTLGHFALISTTFLVLYIEDDFERHQDTRRAALEVRKIARVYSPVQSNEEHHGFRQFCPLRRRATTGFHTLFHVVRVLFFSSSHSFHSAFRPVISHSHLIPSSRTSPASIHTASVATVATTEAPHLVESIWPLPTWLTRCARYSLIAPTRDPLFDISMMAWIFHPSLHRHPSIIVLDISTPSYYFTLLSTSTRCLRVLPTRSNKIDKHVKHTKPQQLATQQFLQP